MCGIFGYAGTGNAAGNIISGLKRLEYRGYDSWGVAVSEGGKIRISKKTGHIGDVADIAKLPDAVIGIGHTRWATHGGVTERNAHPHYSSDGSFVLAQNGIVENYQELKQRLQKTGYKFISETDTEVIVRLIEQELKTKSSMHAAVISTFNKLKGRNTIILLTADGGKITAVRNGSPLVVGVGKDEVYFASDTLSFADKTDMVVYLNDLEMVEYDGGVLKSYDVTTGKELKPLLAAIRKAGTVYTVGAGTASFAAGEIAYFLRKYAKVRAIELKAYETGSYRKLFGKGDLLIAVSQSGETADTLEAVGLARAKGAKIASIVNMIGSTLTRISDLPYFSRTGPEICVASTKAFTAQCAWGLLVAKSLSGQYKDYRKQVQQLSFKLEKYFDTPLLVRIKAIARRLKTPEHFFVLGKGQNYYIAVEGALKVKEITYKHFEGFAAGELKHGVIALIEKGTPVFVIVSDDEDKADMLSAAAEVKARGAWVVGVANEDNELFDDFIRTLPAGELDPLTNVIPFQLLSYYLGVALGNSPDKPRNLAKSVTVK